MIVSLRTPRAIGALLVLAGLALAPVASRAQVGAPPPAAESEAYAQWKQAQAVPGPAPPTRPPAPPQSGGGADLLFPFPGEGGWTELPPNDDFFSGLVPLGFTFEFYGAAYNDVCVNNNGNVSFLDCFSTFTATGFPSVDFTMVAPFWADVDTRCAECGLAYYKQATVNDVPVFVAHWEAVGYFSQSSDKVNTFQVVLADSPVLPGGNNACLAYGDMQWTTGNASGGTGGFGGTPSTVGANAGDGESFFLVGRFDHEGVDYDGPGGVADGVSFLDDTQFCFNTGGGTSNVPPVASGFSDGERFTVPAGGTFTRAFSFLSPEIGQTTEIAVDAGGLDNFSADVTPGNPAVVDVTFNPVAGQIGSHDVTFTATDDGTPPLTTVATIQLVVQSEVNQAPEAIDDVAQTVTGVPVRIDVLANDTDANGDPLSLVDLGSPESGTATIVGDEAEYLPAIGFVGIDAFTYVVGDGRGGTDEGSVSVTVTEEAVLVEVDSEPQAGDGAGVEITVQGFEPTEGELFYRRGGATSYASVPLVSEAGVYAADLPADAVTLRGIDYHVSLTDGETTVTFPDVNPQQAPAHLRVAVPSAMSEAPPPPDGTYRMVSVPVDLDDPDPAAAFEDDYGPYDPADWRLLRWEPGPGRYAEFPDLGAALTPGTAFWLATRNGSSFDVESGQSVDGSGPMSLSLSPGWNQIGSPFAFPVAWADVGGTEGVGDPVAWDGVEYVFEQAVLAPWAGYFVENRTGSAVAVTVPPSSADGSRGSAHAEAVGYQLRLQAVAAGPSGSLRDTHNYLGFAEGAAKGLDRLDWTEPPPPGAHLRLSVMEEGRQLARSVRPAGRAGAAWEVEVAAPADLLRLGPLDVGLRLLDLGERPDGYGVHVLDLDRATALPSDPEGIRLRLTSEAPVRRLRVIVGTEAFAQTASQGVPLVPLADALLPAFPNPAHGAAVIPYQLAERGPVTLAVYDLLGRRIALLVDEEQDGGRHEATWEASVASGVYVYRLRAGAFVATGKLSVIR
ncbi:MAG: Ig-like domain-containing protein [Rubricoccaceae bacterium]|nr:Ig-like domain-containing protein [Rubricoccaceae bacterium]